MTQLDVLFHDYGGHAFTAQIARHLASRGLTTMYISFAGFATPKGHVDKKAGDPRTFFAEQIDISLPFDKDNLLRRRQQQIEYARLAAKRVIAAEPKIVVSSNCPLEVQQHLLNACRKVGAKFVFWLQDIHSEAIGRILGNKSRLLGRLAGRYYEGIEKSLLSKSDGVIAIASDFIELIGPNGWGLAVDHVVTIENWAPIEDIPLLPRHNSVATKLYRAGRTRITYSGTLARKHNPELLLHLARSLDADIHLFSEGKAAKYVQDTAHAEGLENMIVAPWVRVEDLPKTLAGADILCAFIEDDAGRFSVPSKVLSYLSAGRPILASIPEENLAARTIRSANAGLVAASDSPEAFVEAAKTLLADGHLRQQLGKNGRAYAERAFDINQKCDRFVEFFDQIERRRRYNAAAQIGEANKYG